MHTEMEISCQKVVEWLKRNEKYQTERLAAFQRNRQTSLQYKPSNRILSLAQPRVKPSPSSQARCAAHDTSARDKSPMKFGTLSSPHVERQPSASRRPQPPPSHNDQTLKKVLDQYASGPLIGGRPREVKRTEYNNIMPSRPVVKRPAIPRVPMDNRLPSIQQHVHPTPRCRYVPSSRILELAKPRVRGGNDNSTRKRLP